MKEQAKIRFLAAVLCTVMLLSCLLVSGGSVMAADESKTDSRVYLTASTELCIEHINAKTAPQKDGYLFAGWVAKKSDGTGVAIKSATDPVLSEAGVTVTAKFIPAHLATAACQVKSNTYEEGVQQTDLRVVSVVDDGTYQAFGFNLYKRMLNDETMTYEETPMCQYSTVGENPSETLDRYSGMYVYNGSEKTVKTPEDIFGQDAKGFYFTTVRIANIPASVYDSCIFVIKPYWITADGTYVEGLGEYDRVSDGKNGIVNISVNIKDAGDIAAGMLNVNYNQENYSFVSADCGRVFEEMKVKEENGTVKCVGNVENILQNSENPEDIYINLRFRKIGNPVAGSSVFTVESEEFCNVDEETAQVVIEDVIH